MPLNVHLLDALQEEERPLAELSQAVGLPPASTLRAYLRSLTEWGVVERKRSPAFPGAVSYELTDAGERLLATGRVLQRWLEAAPYGGIGLGSPAAKSSVKALVDGWDAAIVRALAARPCALTELARAIPQISYPALERRLTAMRRVGLVEARREGNGPGTPYGATAWLRKGVAPLIAATAWERRHASARCDPIGRLEVEACFLLALPMLRLPEAISGSCRLGVELRDGSKRTYAGVTVTVEEGRAASAAARLDDAPDAWVSGTTAGWYRWINGRDEDEVELGGDTTLVLGFAGALRELLVPSPRV